MTIYRGDTPLKAYKGDMQPVNVYKGAAKVAGWHAQTVAGEGVISLDGAYNVPPDALVIDGNCVQTVGVWGTNLDTNGDFSNGTTGWYRNVPFCTIAASNNELVCTHVTGSVASGVFHPIPNIIVGNQYYVRANVLPKYASNFRIGIGGISKALMTIANQWNSHSAVLTAVNTIAATLYLDTTANYIEGDTWKISNALAIDLTAAFGAGNEPTAAQMDAYLAEYPNSWFNGSALLTTSGIPNSPSPTYPAPITSITGDLTITGANGDLSDTVVTPLGTVELCSLPDGTKDTYDAVTGVVTKRVGKAVFDGSADEGWFIGTYPFVYYSLLLPSLSISYSYLTCDRYTGSTSISDGCYIANYGQNFYVREPSYGGSDVASWRTWLAANPVTVYYKLAAPTTIQLTPSLPVVRTGIKSLSVSGDVAPTIHATVKAMD